MRMRRVVAILFLAACSKSEEAQRSTPAPSASVPESTATTTPTATNAPATPDLVPRDEAIAGSILVDDAADGVRYQLPAGFKPANDAQGSWSGKVKGTNEEAALTVWAARTKFKGDIDALAASETKDIVASGGKVDLTGPVLVWIAGRAEPARGRRLLGRFDDRLDYRVLVVRAPNAYVFHCQTPQAPDAWANVGSECMARGTTFHVAPPSVH